MRATGLSRRAILGLETGQHKSPLAVLGQARPPKHAPAAAAASTSSQTARGLTTCAASSSSRASNEEYSRSKHRLSEPGRPNSKSVPKHRYLAVRNYASEATVTPAAEPVHLNSHQASSDTMLLSTSSPSEASTSQQTLQEQARQLQALLVDATGSKNSGKQRQISWSDQEGGAEEEEQWYHRLEWAANQALSSRSTVVTILGDSSEDLAKFSQALLSDPLASDQSPSQALNARVQTARKVRNQEQVRKLRYNPPSSISTADTEDALTSAAVSSRFLADNNIELQEALFDSAAPSLSSSLWTTLLTSDVVIVQADPTASSDIYRLLQKKNVIFTALSLAKFNAGTRIFEPVTSSRSSADRQAMQIDLDQALQANNMLQSNSHSTLSDFSSLSLRSGIPQISEHISNLATSTTTRQETVRNILARAILDFASNLAAAHQLLYEAEGKIGRLVLTTARDRKHSEIELAFTDLDKLDLEQLVSDSPPRVAGKGTSAQTAVIDAKAPSSEVHLNPNTSGIEEVVLLEDGTRGVETALNSKRLSWWKLPLGRADDVATDLAISLSTCFAGLERKLIFETGRLAERSLDLSLQVNSLLKSPIFARPADKTKLSFYSATMENDIAILSPTTQFGFPPPSHPSAYNLSQTSLSAPIESRRSQLKAPGGAIERLQLRAQSCVVQFYSLSGLSTAAAVFLNQTSWLQIHQDVPSCVGLAGLGIAAAAWRLQGGWKKSKSRFWTDWKRAQEGLAFDLQANADEVLSKKVFVKADIACKVIREHLNLRKSALKNLEQRLRLAQQAINRDGQGLRQ